MSRLLLKPDDPWTAFLKGAGATALAVGLPLFLRMLFIGSGEPWGKRLLVMATIIGSFCLIAGTARLLWSLIQNWAYRRITD
jgi:hypothetical protein